MLMLFASCKSDMQSQQSNEEVVAVEHFEVKYYVTNVNSLRARSGSKKSSEVITKIKEGTILKDLKEETHTRETVTLRGVEYTEPYRKVELPSGKQVWVYGGALRAFYAGTTDISEVNVVSTLQRYLLDLPSDNIDSGNAILKKLLQLSSDDPSTNDALFFLSYDYMSSLAYNLSMNTDSSLNWALDSYQDITDRKFDLSSHILGKKIEQSGLKLDASEGQVYYEIDIKTLDGAIGGVFTTATKKYIELSSQIYDHRLFSDAAIVSSLNLLADDAIKWTTFVNKYPDFTDSVKANQIAQYYTSAVMTGTNNTLAFDPETLIATNGFRSMWDYMIKTYPRHPLTLLIISQRQKLESNSWKFDN